MANQGKFGHGNKPVPEGYKRFDLWVDALRKRAPVRGWALRIVTRLSRGPVQPRRSVLVQNLTRFGARQINRRAPWLFNLIASSTFLRKVYRRATTKPPVVVVTPLRMVEIVHQPRELRDPRLADLLLTEMTLWTPGKRIDA